MSAPPTPLPAEQVAAAQPILSAPDWAVQTIDMHCPLCEYNLRGLIEPRCPECGHRFEWTVLLDARQHQHPYLFEHHPERNVRSFFRTLRGGLLPRRFWSELKPVQPIRPGRLSSYACLAAFIGVAGQTAAWAMMTTMQITRFFTTYRILLPRWWWWRRALLASGILLAIELAWPWITFLALMVFQISMRRAGIKKLHVVRCVVYSSDIVAWSGLAALILAAVMFTMDMLSRRGPYTMSPDIILWLILFTIALMEYRLYIAYKKYLAFDKPFATVLASQIITALFLLCCIFWMH